MPREIYLHDIPLNEALERLVQALENEGIGGVLGTELVPLTEELAGRTLSMPVWAKTSSPHYHAAAMDGFAVIARQTDNAMPTQPVLLTYGPQTSYVDTGDPLPEWANAVIPIENVEALAVDGSLASDPRAPAQIRIRAAVTPWRNVRPMGEDIVATELVMPAGHPLRPVDIGAIAASGHSEVRVARKPKVAILPTGTELVEIGAPVKRGEIIEYNSLVLAAQVNGWGGEATRFPKSPDDLEEIKHKVREAAATHDLVLLNAGSSAGKEDYSAQVVTELGDLLVHGVAVRPGHPVILGLIRCEDRHAIPLIGVPGFPVSAALTGEIFVEPLLARWLGRAPFSPPTIEATLTRKLVSPAGDDDYVRVAVGKVGDRVLAAPLARGAGVISSLVRADGIAILPRGSQGMAAGEKMRVRLYRTQTEIEKTLLHIGSHDLTLDLLAQFMSQHERRLASANAGSQAGLVALKRGEAHFAGSHLLDPETGEYNIRYIQQYLPGRAVVLVALVGREQGLLVQAGNPKSISGLADLERDDVRFVNRQRGAGTRVLLDYHLNRLGISKISIQGYDEEEFTHLAVAAAVVSGRADCGLGIKGAAQALDLDFIPLFQERYDLVIPREHAVSELMKPLFTLLGDPTFKDAVAGLPGYDISPMGKIITELE
jgi:putative molybdopterin biosynthesis protein